MSITMSKHLTLHSRCLIGLYIDWTGEGELNVYTISNSILNAKSHLNNKAIKIHLEPDAILYAILADKEVHSHLEYKDIDSKNLIYTIHPRLRKWLFVVKYYSKEYKKSCKKLKVTRMNLLAYLSGYQ